MDVTLLTSLRYNHFECWFVSLKTRVGQPFHSVPPVEIPYETLRDLISLDIVYERS